MSKANEDKLVVPKDKVKRTKTLALLSNTDRQKHILEKNGWDSEVCAAIEIQRIFRGYTTRCRIHDILHPSTSKTAVYGESKSLLARVRDDLSSPNPVQDELRKQYDEYVAWMVQNGYSSDEIMSFESFSAKKVEEWSKNDEANKLPTFDPIEEEEKARKAKRRQQAAEAATKIQRAWRKHIDTQVYKYYRDLINFKAKGDPAMMLRCINPNEAKLLDAAMGVHVKFRLAGARFPPNIYYKIFTHRPVQDLCANSPKDYTKAELKRLNIKSLHNKGQRLTASDDDRSGWYLRMENNGWRLVSDRLIHHIMSDPVTWETSKKTIDFHHNRLQRRQDVEQKKKQKKINWMRKMYKEGMLQAKVDDKETVTLIDGAAAGMVATVDAHGSQAVQEWEVDELLDWTTGLNFDDYLNGWKELATSSLSEKLIEERFNLTVNNRDPFEIGISQNLRNKSTSTRQSRNTPATTPSVISVGD